MSRLRLLLISIVVLILAIIGRITQQAIAAEEVQKVTVTPGKPQRAITFRDRLVVGLQARLKSEVAFIDAVVAKVNGGQLPQRVVDESFFWARRRRRDDPRKSHIQAYQILPASDEGPSGKAPHHAVGEPFEPDVRRAGASHRQPGRAD